MKLKQFQVHTACNWILMEESASSLQIITFKMSLLLK